MDHILKKLKPLNPFAMGPRLLKTWLATSLAAALGETMIVGNVFFALMGAVMGMQNTVKNSWTLGIGRIIGTILGAFIGFIFAHFELTSPLFAGFAIVLTIMICLQIRLQHSLLITLTLCLLIMFSPDQEGGLWNYTVFRVLDTITGVVIGFLVNRFIYPPQHLKLLVQQIHAFANTATEVARNRQMLPKLASELAKLDTFYSNYELDVKYDHTDINNEKLKETMDQAHDLHFHYKMIDGGGPSEVLAFHEERINETMDQLHITIDELLKELYLK